MNSCKNLKKLFSKNFQKKMVKNHKKATRRVKYMLNQGSIRLNKINRNLKPLCKDNHNKVNKNICNSLYKIYGKKGKLNTKKNKALSNIKKKFNCTNKRFNNSRRLINSLCKK